ncbi:MAG: EAL domain-containing protein [Plesiomonas sp.]|uniref:EAL domain-containing protein n=1 Tax=Plesiomonas sp. TaxID=2486279 RepID=UPI003F391332
MRLLPSMHFRYHSYIRDISIIFLILLPLTLSNAIAIFSAHTLNYIDFPDLAHAVFRLSDLLIGIYPIALCVITTYYLSHKKSTNSVIAIIYALVMLYIISINNNGLSDYLHLPNNPLTALFSAFITTSYCSRFQLRPLDPSQVDFSRDLFRQVGHFFVFSLLALGLSLASMHLLREVDVYRQQMQLNPLSVKGGLVYQLILGALGSVGINGHNFLFSAKQALFATTQANLVAWHAGNASLNILSQGFYDVFLSMGGSGNSLSLLLCILLFSKDRRHLTLAIAALPLGMFNINELILFGLPVIFNPLLIIPFITVPLLSFGIAYIAMSSGLVSPVTTIVDWMTPPLLSGYLATNNSLQGFLLQLVILTIGVLVYRPFYLRYAGRSQQINQHISRKQEVEKITFGHFIEDIKSAADDSVRKAQAQQRVNRLLSEGQFVMYYQPQQYRHNIDKCSFESLVRYRDPTGHLHAPTFIADFQLLGVMPQLDKIVLERVLADMQKMDLLVGERIAINMSAASISQSNFVSHLTERLMHYGISPHSIEVEITEEAILGDIVQVRDNMSALQDLGVYVAMDDFGSGYASFPHLFKYHFDKVKLDRSLLIDAKHPRGQQLYRLLAQIGHVAKCDVVAEGVETQEEQNFVDACGIDMVQGFGISAPLPLKEVLVRLARRRNKL